jgi:hypothetical protein
MFSVTSHQSSAPLQEHPLPEHPNPVHFCHPATEKPDRRSQSCFLVSSAYDAYSQGFGFYHPGSLDVCRIISINEGGFLSTTKDEGAAFQKLSRSSWNQSTSILYPESHLNVRGCSSYAPNFLIMLSCGYQIAQAASGFYDIQVIDNHNVLGCSIHIE